VYDHSRNYHVDTDLSCLCHTVTEKLWVFKLSIVARTSFERYYCMRIRLQSPCRKTCALSRKTSSLSPLKRKGVDDNARTLPFARPAHLSHPVSIFTFFRLIRAIILYCFVRLRGHLQPFLQSHGRLYKSRGPACGGVLNKQFYSEWFGLLLHASGKYNQVNFPLNLN
jgi:hypothetical protein